MVRYMRLYGLFLTQRLKILMEYRLNFFIGAFSFVLMQSVGLVGLWAVMRQVPSLNGWKYDELLLIYGLIHLGKSMTHMFADNLWTIGFAYIRTGGFDRFLVRPINPLFHLLADRFCHDGIGDFVVGAALVSYASQALGIPWTPLNLGYLLLTTLTGGIIFISLHLISASSAFWIVESRPLTQIVHLPHEFAFYPLDIYHRSIRTALTWVLPYGFASFYPASFLLGRDISWLVWAGPLVAVALLALAYRVWLLGLSHYGSTGS
jgi:ABC-2 type transport system permease protein